MKKALIGATYTINQEETMETIKQLWSQGTHLWKDHKKAVIIGVIAIIIIISLVN